MYDVIVPKVRIVQGETKAFPVFLSLCVTDGWTWHIHDEDPWCMLFADDTILADKTREEISLKRERWKELVESRKILELVEWKQNI